MWKKLSYFIVVASFLQSCQFVTAQNEGELTFVEVKNNWDYAAEVTPPGFIEQVAKENLDSDWIGDPKRFQVIKVSNFGQKSLYFIYPGFPCPEIGCQSQELYDLYHPACNTSGGCAYLLYVDENGKYRKVFDQQFWVLTGKNDTLLRVSRQLDQGLPACIELMGEDDKTKYKGGLPQLPENQAYLSRYCYNGKEYTLDKVYPTNRASN